MPKGPKPRPIAERFWEKVDRNGPVPEKRPDLGPCWIWTAALHRNGYGKFGLGRKGNTGVTALAHRVAYELDGGTLVDGLELDHLCEVRACVRRSHLDQVVGIDNNLRSNSSAAKNARKTHCPQGHEYDEANTYVRPTGQRVCRTCHRERQARRSREAALHAA